MNHDREEFCRGFITDNIVIIEDLIGKTFDSVSKDSCDQLSFSNKDESYLFYYEPDCCASCEIEDICGDLDDLVGAPILTAESVSRDATEGEIREINDSGTWTFYRFATIKGYVTVRWLGTSNGYYSESVSFKKL